MNRIQKLILVVIMFLCSTSLYGQQYKLWMGKHLKKHDNIENSVLNGYTTIESDKKTMYFPYFFIGGRSEAQLHYFGQLHLTDSLLIFEYQKKRSHVNHPHIKSFIINPEDITEYEISDNNSGIIIKTNNINYMFLSSLSDNFKTQLIEKLKKE